MGGEFFRGESEEEDRSGYGEGVVAEHHGTAACVGVSADDARPGEGVGVDEPCADAADEVDECCGDEKGGPVLGRRVRRDASGEGARADDVCGPEIGEDEWDGEEGDELEPRGPASAGGGIGGDAGWDRGGLGGSCGDGFGLEGECGGGKEERPENQKD